MRDLILAILILFGAAVVLVLIFAFIAAATRYEDKFDEDAAQQNFMKGYFQRKDDNND